jgi:hypothetical protein
MKSSSLYIVPLDADLPTGVRSGIRQNAENLKYSIAPDLLSFCPLGFRTIHSRA